MTIFSQRFDRRTAVSVLWITVVFVITFFLLRALPDAKCGFLHYEEVVNAEGQIEFCATNHAGFLDLSKLSYPVRMELETGSPLVAGQEQEITLRLETSGGMPIAGHELAITHTEKMHIMLIDPSVEDYHHIHPEVMGTDGRYRFRFTPKSSGPYAVYAEIVPLRTRRQVIATGHLEVSGESRKGHFESNRICQSSGLYFELFGDDDRLKTGRDYRFELRVSEDGGNAADLESIMGAKGHLVAFDAERRGFAHMHPISSVRAEKPSADAEAPLAFLFNVPNPGWYRIFAQVQVDGAVVFGRFDLWVE